MTTLESFNQLIRQVIETNVHILHGNKQSQSHYSVFDSFEDNAARE